MGERPCPAVVPVTERLGDDSYDAVVVLVGRMQLEAALAAQRATTTIHPLRGQ